MGNSNQKVDLKKFTLTVHVCVSDREEKGERGVGRGNGLKDEEAEDQEACA